MAAYVYADGVLVQSITDVSKVLAGSHSQSSVAELFYGGEISLSDKARVQSTLTAMIRFHFLSKGIDLGILGRFTLGYCRKEKGEYSGSFLNAVFRKHDGQTTNFVSIYFDEHDECRMLKPYWTRLNVERDTGQAFFNRCRFLSLGHFKVTHDYRPTSILDQHAVDFKYLADGECGLDGSIKTHNCIKAHNLMSSVIDINVYSKFIKSVMKAGQANSSRHVSVAGGKIQDVIDDARQHFSEVYGRWVEKVWIVMGVDVSARTMNAGDCIESNKYQKVIYISTNLLLRSHLIVIPADEDLKPSVNYWCGAPEVSTLVAKAHPSIEFTFPKPAVVIANIKNREEI